ncbi:MAG: thymidylate synthase [Spirochaetes bacterium]|nr:thymidylate synthase [Spirochaetota bacterium]
MHILAVIQGTYGQRIIHNLRLNNPESWEIEDWTIPLKLPFIIENPKEFLPEELPRADLLLSLGGNTGAAELIPEIARMSSAKAVIAPIDNRDNLPPGLVNQIKQDLKQSGIDSAFPLPFCSLTEGASNNKYIKEFAGYFGKPKLTVILDQGRINNFTMEREAPCGVTCFVAEKLIGLGSEEAKEKAALFHQYYPCLASGKMDRKFGDSILHRAAHITTAAVKSAITLYLKE